MDDIINELFSNRNKPTFRGTGSPGKPNNTTAFAQFTLPTFSIAEELNKEAKEEKLLLTKQQILEARLKDVQEGKLQSEADKYNNYEECLRIQAELGIKEEKESEKRK